MTEKQRKADKYMNMPVKNQNENGNQNQNEDFTSEI